MGSLTMVGTVSPAGGNFDEPVTQSTLGTVKTFLGLSSARAYKRFYPAVDPLISWSRYLDQLRPYFDEHLQPGWTDAVHTLSQLLHQGESISQMMQVTGEEGITLEDYVTYQKSLLLDMVYLQQDAYDKVDVSVPLERQKEILGTGPRADPARLPVRGQGGSPPLLHTTHGPVEESELYPAGCEGLYRISGSDRRPRQKLWVGRPRQRLAEPEGLPPADPLAGKRPTKGERIMPISPYAGKPAEPSLLINVPQLVTAYYTGRPDPSVPAQRVVFGTSGHRGSSLDNAFNEAHILAITQAICQYRQQQGIDGPLFLGMDTHALSEPAFASALEVLAANGVEVMVDATHPYTPTPVISHAILTHNRGRTRGLADGIVITPSHNPPQYGGFKYDPPQGGPADTHVTAWIEQHANAFLADGLREVRRVSLERARQASTTHRHDYLEAYVGDLPAVVDLEAIRGSRVHVGVDPLGGASVAYWDAIGERYGLNLEW